MVGCPAVVLHWVIPPGPSLKPETVMVTVWASFRFVDGDALMTGSATEGCWPAKRTAVVIAPATTTNESPLRPTTTLRSPGDETATVAGTSRSGQNASDAT